MSTSRLRVSRRQPYALPVSLRRRVYRENTLLPIVRFVKSCFFLLSRVFAFAMFDVGEWMTWSKRVVSASDALSNEK